MSPIDTSECDEQVEVRQSRVLDHVDERGVRIGEFAQIVPELLHLVSDLTVVEAK